MLNCRKRKFSTYYYDKLCPYYDHNISDATLRELLHNISDAMLQLLCYYIKIDLKSLGISAADLGILGF